MSVAPLPLSSHRSDRLYRLSDQQYANLRTAGILADETLVENLNGLLTWKNPADPLDDLYRLSVDQYHKMIAAELLTSEDPVELIQGILVQKMSKNAPHRVALARAVRALSHAVPTGWSVQAQDPITLSDSEPEPDACIIRGLPEDYPLSHPSPTDVSLVVEVADTTLRFDRGVKQSIYAAAKIPTYWIINLLARTVEVYTQPVVALDPAESFYRHIATLTPEQQVSLILDEKPITIPVAALLP